MESIFEKIIIVIIYLFCFFYNLSLYYVFKHQLIDNRKHFIIYWFDFLIVLISYTIYIIFETIYKEKFDESIFSIVIILVSYFFINFTVCLKILIKIFSFNRIDIKNEETKNVIKKIKNLNIIGIYNKIHHLIIIFFFLILFTIINLSFKLYDKKIIIKTLIITTLIIQIIQFLIFEKIYKSYLLSVKKYSINITNEKIYNLNKTKLAIISEHFIYKNLFDMLLIFPLLNFIKNETLNKYILSIFVYFYILFFGSFIIIIDKNNNSDIPILTRKIYFFYYWYNLNFINKNPNSQMNIFKNDINLNNVNEFIYNDFEEENENKIENFDQILKYYSTELESNSNTDYDDLDSDDYLNVSSYNSHSFETSKHFFNEYIRQKILTERDKTKYYELNDFIPSNFYIIFKILNLYFSDNFSIYNQIDEALESEAIPFRNSINKIIGPSTQLLNNLDNKNLLERINRISRISLLNKEILNTNLKYNFNDIFNTYDNIYKEEFIKYIIHNPNNKTKNKSFNINNLTFKIESLFGEKLFEIFPFFEINVKDLLFSLEINNNSYEIFKNFFDLKYKNNQFNSFYTNDSFLSFEIYDINNIQIFQLKEIIDKYQSYLIEKFSKFQPTFLPLIIGLFNINYKISENNEFNKIILLYRNPLCFTRFINYYYWIKFEMIDKFEKIEKSKTDDIIELNEIIKKDLFVNVDDFELLHNILKSDFNFIKQLKFNLGFKLNLFVIHDVNSNKIISVKNSLESSENLMMEVVGSLKNKNIKDNNNNNESFSNSEIETKNKENKDDNIKINSLLRISDLFVDTITQNIINKKKFFSSDVVSVLEKLFFNMDENRYIFKIFFSEILNKKNNNENDSLNKKKIKGELNLNSFSNIIPNNQNSNKDSNNNTINEDFDENNKKYCEEIEKRLNKLINKFSDNFLT